VKGHKKSFISNTFLNNCKNKQTDHKKNYSFHVDVIKNKQKTNATQINIADYNL